ncbi:glutathione peroxidase [Flavilitoribacter nigricans]|uniref:Glutathione peroxidase n=1 Tax=Flavilitoribacter nigricans (strain ATCC 23147 / DSM 23189 / NBRC 102662 / NCIMB 1420 / SS-2) TaxID=1122177 RepID=A0A2D0N657_FLAN2|nr:glutathione peroxidase [Flavilitoribacter nigricans]PHN03984.1 glutathione peroxidase [Flavilitoribacter nigricans DSM 23189 = NBRC 102662]
MSSIHQFKVAGIGQEEIDFADFSGKKILVVNVASECGFTPQYKQLQELYEYFNDKLVVVGFPCNDFGGQEPGNADTIQQFCERNYGVSFPLAAKININSSEPHPIYQWLTQKARNGKLDATVNWNFNKFLLDEKGQLLAHFPASVSPVDPAVTDLIQDQ